MIKHMVWSFCFCLLVAWRLASPAPSVAQETSYNLPAGPAATIDDSDEARRETVLEVLERPEVRNTAKAAGIDLAGVAAGIERLEGEPLARAARQAEELDHRLAIDGTISSTTLIILLVATVLLIVLIQS